MKRRLVLGTVLIAFAFVNPAPAQEKLVLSSPVFATVGATDFRVESIYLKRETIVNSLGDSDAEIRALFREVNGTVFVQNGRTLICQYTGATAETLVRQLNTTNLSTISLEKRVTNRCQTDGKLGAGSVTGTPQ